MPRGNARRARTITRAPDDDTKLINASGGLWAGGAAILLALLAFGLIDPSNGTVPFFVVLGIASIAYLATLRQIANGLRPSGRALIACALLALAWRVPLLLAPPEPAADVRRYVWDARLVRAGLSPYTVVPADPAFAHLRTRESWPVNNADVPSPYPPGAQLFFLAATALRESALAIKIAALISDALLGFVVWRWLVAVGANPGWLLAYLWNPLVSLEVARHGHVDVVGALCLAVAALALVRGRSLLGSVGFALSLAVKPLPVVLLPLLWRRISRRDLAVGIVVLVALYLPFWDGHRFPIGSMPEVIERFRFNGPIFTAVASVAGSTAATGVALAAGLVVAARARRRFSVTSPEAWAWPMAAALLAAPLIYPWYLLWLAPFLIAPAAVPLTIWTVSILSTYVVWQLPGGHWAVPGWALLIQYGALLGAGLWLWRRKRPEWAPQLGSPSVPPSTTTVP